jgi:hypothetical protein
VLTVHQLRDALVGALGSARVWFTVSTFRDCKIEVRHNQSLGSSVQLQIPRASLDLARTQHRKTLAHREQINDLENTK